MSGSDKPARPSTSGILVLDKPVGMTSMTAVSVVRGKAQKAKTGHAGTLDPLASGVLVLALGPATKTLNRLMATDKRYRTVIDLSAFTETDDLEAERVEMRIDEPPDEAAVRAALGRFVGRFEQRPPAFSAVKVEGRRAYRMARKGKAVDLPARPVLVHDIELRSCEWPTVELAIHCAKGFYVRSLARDLGRTLGTGGHCVSIRRTAVGPFTERMAVPLDDVPEPLGEEHLIPTETALKMVEEAAGSG
ncbi:MAG: tRNA pseudouridine(55) synthase TruB [Phycisphaerales bacterium]|nr:MAG: tRNA pseudouridine(55) synthase TruB [Phycisphaerales bacterium]